LAHHYADVLILAATLEQPGWTQSAATQATDSTCLPEQPQAHLFQPQPPQSFVPVDGLRCFSQHLHPSQASASHIQIGTSQHSPVLDSSQLLPQQLGYQQLLETLSIEVMVPAGQDDYRVLPMPAGLQSHTHLGPGNVLHDLVVPPNQGQASLSPIRLSSSSCPVTNTSSPGNPCLLQQPSQVQQGPDLAYQSQYLTQVEVPAGSHALSLEQHLSPAARSMLPKESSLSKSALAYSALPLNGQRLQHRKQQGMSMAFGTGSIQAATNSSDDDSRGGLQSGLQSVDQLQIAKSCDEHSSNQRMPGAAFDALLAVHC